MNQSWTSGYVADIAYIEGFYVQQSPARMALACLFGNVAVDLPEPDDAACYLELGCGLRHRRARHGGGQSGLAGHGDRLQSGSYRHRRRSRPRRAPRQYSLHRSRPRAAGDERPGRRHSPGRLRQHARPVVVGQQRGARRHRRAAGRQDAPGRHGPSELQRLAGLAGRARHAATDLRGRHPGRRPQRHAGPGRPCAGARPQGGREQISHREQSHARPARHAPSPCRRNTFPTNT